MKRLLFAGFLILPFTLVRTYAHAERDDAYGSLVGMADSASRDRGPQAGEIPPAGVPARMKKAAKQAPAPMAGPAAAPRVWTRLFASLLPSRAHVSFGVAVSTALVKN